MKYAFILCGVAACAFLLWWTMHSTDLTLGSVAGTWELDPEKSSFVNQVERDGVVKRWQGQLVVIGPDSLTVEGPLARPQPITVESVSAERLWLRQGETKITLTPVDASLMWYDGKQLLILRRQTAP